MASTTAATTTRESPRPSPILKTRKLLFSSRPLSKRNMKALTTMATKRVLCRNARRLRLQRSLETTPAVARGLACAASFSSTHSTSTITPSPSPLPSPTHAPRLALACIQLLRHAHSHSPAHSSEHAQPPIARRPPCAQTHQLIPHTRCVPARARATALSLPPRTMRLRDLELDVPLLSLGGAGGAVDVPDLALPTSAPSRPAPPRIPPGRSGECRGLANGYKLQADHPQTQTTPLPALSPPNRTALARTAYLPLVAPSGVQDYVVAFARGLGASMSASSRDDSAHPRSPSPCSKFEFRVYVYLEQIRETITIIPNSHSTNTSPNSMPTSTTTTMPTSLSSIFATPDSTSAPFSSSISTTVPASAPARSKYAAETQEARHDEGDALGAGGGCASESVDEHVDGQSTGEKDAEISSVPGNEESDPADHELAEAAKGPADDEKTTKARISSSSPPARTPSRRGSRWGIRATGFHQRGRLPRLLLHPHLRPMRPSPKALLLRARWEFGGESGGEPDGSPLASPTAPSFAAAMQASAAGYAHASPAVRTFGEAIEGVVEAAAFNVGVGKAAFAGFAGTFGRERKERKESDSDTDTDADSLAMPTFAPTVRTRRRKEAAAAASPAFASAGHGHGHDRKLGNTPSSFSSFSSISRRSSPSPLSAVFPASLLFAPTSASSPPVKLRPGYG
ncbi:hypothetical protein B0H13DRAFT_2321907 [Mycena leptocephala]|nr:hypothetical protein B0H13DRAFT_2321907 [Mycena leptocephala]